MGVDPDDAEAGVFRISDVPSSDRATVALVLSEIRGLRDFADARFADVQRQLDAQSELPSKVEALTAKFVRLDARVTTVEESDTMKQTAAEKRRDYRAGTLPIILIGVVSTLANVVLFLAR